jgi:hypothetical protein
MSTHRHGRALAKRYGHAVLGPKVQDAFHYALMAAGGEVDGFESAFTSQRRHDYSPSGYLRAAKREAREAGLKLPRHPSKVAEEGAWLARAIRDEAAKVGIDANAGEPFERRS